MGGDTVESSAQNREIVSHNIVGVHHDGSRGFRNDVHVANTFRWRAYRDRVEKTRYNKGMPHVQGEMEWEQKNDGQLPPSDLTYDEWTQCDYDAWEKEAKPAVYAARAKSGNCEDLFVAPGSYMEDTMWSPRRGHASTVHGGSTILVMGGRAREHKRMEMERNVGGIKTRPMANDKFYSAWREATVLKNDVWASTDEGVSWELMNPGCKVPQEDLVLAGQPYVRTRVGGWRKEFTDPNNGVDPHTGVNRDETHVWNGPGENVNQHLVLDLPRYGAEKDQCSSNDACWGDAECRTLGKGGTCVCNIWSPRELHAACSHSWDEVVEVVYVGGGFASKQERVCGDFACGDTDAGAYREYMRDLWKSEDKGVTWSVVTLHAPWEGRGGHSLVSFLGSVWLFNGQGGVSGQHPSKGSHQTFSEERGTTYFSELWRLESSGGVWTKDLKSFTLSGNGTTPHWAPRFGHSSVVEKPNAFNKDITKLFMLGGRDGDGFLSDSWSWRGPAYDWVRDFSGATEQAHYVDRDTSVQNLRNVVPNNNKWAQDAIKRENFTTAADLGLLHALGIFTVGDLANADRRTILKLRGFDLPQVPEGERLRWSEEKGGSNGVCYMYVLAKAMLEKCHSLKPELVWVDGEQQLPRNNRPLFSDSDPNHQGNPPSEGQGVISEWHGVDYGNLPLHLDTYHKPSMEELVEQWDGCSPLERGEGTWPDVDVNSIGNVPQVAGWRHDLNQQAMEITCKQTPFPRAFHSSVYFAQQIWVIGGKRTVDDHNNDLWYRDDIMPLSVLNTYPASDSAETLFTFKSNKEGSVFRYRVYFGDKLKELRPWSKVFTQESVGWLKGYNDVGEVSNTHTELGKGQEENEGPGHGNYIFYLRAVDPAGNEDATYDEGRNMHTWRYSPDPPAVLISIVFITLFCFACYIGYEYHKYQRAMALERFAIKRVRRKFKGMMAEGGDRDAKSLHKKAKSKKGKKGKKIKKKKKKKAKKGKDGQESERHWREKIKENEG